MGDEWLEVFAVVCGMVAREVAARNERRPLVLGEFPFSRLGSWTLAPVRLCLDGLPHDGMSYVMATMTHRTSFALDELTARRIKQLATRWNVSQAEVVRRSVERAEGAGQSPEKDALQLLKAYHAKGGLDKARADRWIMEIDEGRKRWRASS